MNYDSAGLMAQIQALIAAPTSSRTRTNNNNKHPYFKRPGRGHNHDTCDACHESGDLLCCDTCSASFHLMCVNPPLDYEQIPAGDWRCHRCLSTQAESGQELEVNKKSSTSGRRVGKKRCAPASGREPPLKKPTYSTKQNKRINLKDGKVVQNFFSQAVELARKMNPEQFVLPKYLMEYGAAQFPGAPRQTAKKGAAKANKQVVEVENGLVPSPISICFVCDISCRRGPMIKCDACSAFFHFECLNPPLTGVPQGRWLCHLHPEPTLEHKTLKSLSLTERVRLYDYAKKPIDPIQVALKFVTKTQRAKHSYFRSKVKIKGKDFTEIPGPIVKCYNEEEDDSHLPHWPSPGEVTCCNCNNNNVYMDEYKITTTESKNLGVSPLELLAQVAAQELDSHKPPMTRVKKSPHNGLDCDVTDLSGIGSKGDDVPKGDERISGDEKLELALKERFKTLGDSILEGVDMDTIFSLAAQKLRELRCNETLENNNSNSSTTKDVVAQEQSNHVDQIDSALPPPLQVPIKEEAYDDEMLTEIVINANPCDDQNDSKTEVGNDVDTKVEIPVPYLKLLIINTSREVTFKEGQIMIGKGQVELDLTEHVACRSITDEHCCIYYDYVGSRWELINYSPNGTIVNKVPYGCTPARKNIKSFPWADNSCPVRSNGIESGSFIWPDERQIKGSCLCRRTDRPTFGDSLEGSAYLEIGSRIQIGCVRIFVVGMGNESKWVPREWLVYSGIAKVPFNSPKAVKTFRKDSKDETNSHNDSASDSRSNHGSDADDDERASSEPERRNVHKVSPAAAAEGRRNGGKPSPSLRGSGRGRGRGRGRGSASARRRASSVQQGGTKPVKILPKKLSTRGRKRKNFPVTPPVVVASNGTSDGRESDNTGESSALAVAAEPQNQAIGDHDYDGPNTAANRLIKPPPPPAASSTNGTGELQV